jgi:hypothetical protein
MGPAGPVTGFPLPLPSHNIPNEITFKSNCEAFVFNILTTNDATNISFLDNTALPSKRSVLPQGSRIYLQLNNFCGQVDNCRYSNIREQKGRGNSFETFRLKETSSEKKMPKWGECFVHRVGRSL